MPDEQDDLEGMSQEELKGRLASYEPRAEPDVEKMPEDQLQARLDSNPEVGKPEWTKEDKPDEPTKKSRINDFMDTHLKAGRSWKEAEEHFQKRFKEEDATPYRKPYEKRLGQGIMLNEAQQELEGSEEKTGRFLQRKMLGSDFFNSIKFGNAKKRFEEGKPEEGDYSLMAQYQKLQQEDAKRSETMGGALGQAALGLPRMGLEFAAGGTVAKGIFKGGATALRAAGMMAPAAEGATVAVPLFSRAATAAAQLPVKTLTVPSMYMDHLTQKNIQEGKDPLDPSNFPKAFGLGMAQMATLEAAGAYTGKLFKGEGLNQAVARVGTQAVTGPLVQAATDVATHAIGLDTHYGTVETLLNQGPEAAIRQATVQAMTFAAFSGQHEIMRAYQVALNKMASSGTTKQEAGKAALEVGDRIAKLHKENPNPTAEEYQEAMQGLPKPIEEYGKQVAQSIGEKKAPAEAPAASPGSPEAPAGQSAPEAAPAAPQGQPEAAKATPEAPAWTPERLKTMREALESVGVPKVKGMSDVKVIQEATKLGLDKAEVKGVEPQKPQKAATYAEPPEEAKPPIGAPESPKGEDNIYHIADYKNPGNSVDAALKILDTKGGPNKRPLWSWDGGDPLEKAGAQLPPEGVALHVDRRHWDTLKGEESPRPGSVEQRDKDIVRAYGEHAVRYDPSLKTIVYGGKEGSPNWNKLKAKVDEINVERADSKLMAEGTKHGQVLPPVKLETIEQHKAGRETKSPKAEEAKPAEMKEGEKSPWREVFEREKKGGMSDNYAKMMADSEHPEGDVAQEKVTEAPASPDASKTFKTSDGQEYANTPRMRALAQEGEAIRGKLPPVPEGHERLWRGNRAGEEGKNPQFTNALEGIALPFLKLYGGKLSYVDVPKNDLAKYSQKIGAAPGNEFVLPGKLAEKAKLAAPERSPEQAKAIDEAYKNADPQGKRKIDPERFAAEEEQESKGMTVKRKGTSRKQKTDNPPPQDDVTQAIKESNLPEVQKAVLSSIHTGNSLRATADNMMLSHESVRKIRDNAFAALQAADPRFRGYKSFEEARRGAILVDEVHGQVEKDMAADKEHVNRMPEAERDKVVQEIMEQVQNHPLLQEEKKGDEEFNRDATHAGLNPASLRSQIASRVQAAIAARRAKDAAQGAPRDARQAPAQTAGPPGGGAEAPGNVVSPLPRYVQRQFDAAKTVADRIHAAADADIAVFDPLYGTAEYKAGGFRSNEALRILDQRYQQLKEAKAGSTRVNESMDSTRKAIDGQIASLRKIGKQKEADWYERVGLPLVEEARRDLGGAEAPGNVIRTGGGTPPLAPGESPKLPGGGQPELQETEQRTEGKKTALANEIVARERKERGQDPILPEAAREDPKVWGEAMDRLDRDPDAGKKLVDELTKQMRPTSDTENALLLQRRVDLRNQHNKAMDAVLKAYDDLHMAAARQRMGKPAGEAPDSVTLDKLDKAVDDITAEMNKTDKVTGGTGTEWGRAGRWRRILAAEDYSLHGMFQKAQAAKGETPLTPEEKVQIAGMQKRIEAAEAARAKAEEALAALKEKGIGAIGGPEHTEWVKVGIESNRAKDVFNQHVADWKESRKSWGEKAKDWFHLWRVAGLISGVKTAGKVTLASGEQIGAAPSRELAGAVISRLPFFSQIAARAPKEGRGFSADIEGKAFWRSFTKGIPDAWQTLKAGKSDLDIQHGGGDEFTESFKGNAGIARKILQFPGALHAAMKATAVRNEWERSYLHRVESASAKGVDVTNPLILTKISLEAYKDSKAAKFQEDNRVVDFFNKGINHLTAKDASGEAKAIGFALKTAVPIVRIPTNVIAQAADYAIGLGTGSVKAGLAFRAGIENLKPEQADKIMRSLKRGAVGAAALLIGAYNADQFGGFYTNKKEEDAKKRQGMKSGSAFGIPEWALHNPLLEQFQIGASFAHAMQAHRKQKVDVGDAILESAVGLAKESPYAHGVEDMGRVFDARQRGHFFGEFLKSVTIPRLVSWIAEKRDENDKGDVQKRKAETMGEHIMSGIPGQREKLQKITH